MSLIRIASVTPLDHLRLRLVPTDGSVVERDVAPLLIGPVFEDVRNNAEVFRAAGVVSGTVVWPNGADLCPDVLIWGGPPRDEAVSKRRRPCHARALSAASRETHTRPSRHRSGGTLIRETGCVH